MSAMQKLRNAWAQGKYLCVGLDLDTAKLPPSLLPGSSHSNYERLLVFATEIIKHTESIAAAYKPNLQYFLGLEVQHMGGINLLREVMDAIREHAPGALIILDGKWGDIGDTNEQSAAFAFDVNGMNADAVTVSPYVGGEALKPFFRPDKMAFVLARTSNPGAGEFQDRLVAPDQTLYQEVAEAVATDWNLNQNLGLVAGATAPQEIRNIRHLALSLPILVPGVGKQGGDLEAAVDAARFRDADGRPHNGGFLVNVSRSLLYASNGSDYVDAAIQCAMGVHSQIVIELAEGRGRH